MRHQLAGRLSDDDNEISTGSDMRLLAETDITADQLIVWDRELCGRICISYIYGYMAYDSGDGGNRGSMVLASGPVRVRAIKTG